MMLFARASFPACLLLLIKFFFGYAEQALGKRLKFIHRSLLWQSDIPRRIASRVPAVSFPFTVGPAPHARSIPYTSAVSRRQTSPPSETAGHHCALAR